MNKKDIREAIKSGDMWEICRLANKQCYQIDQLVDALIERGNAREIAIFLRDVEVEPALMEKLVAKLIETGDSDQLGYVITNVKKVPNDMIVDVLLKTNDAETIAHLGMGRANSLGPTNIAKMADVVIASGDAELMFKFANRAKYAPIEKLENAIIATRDMEWMIKFVRFVEEASLEKFAEAFGTTVEKLEEKIVGKRK